jgi:ABC-type glycerol-3-phosphate transport system substrate-binding protein
MLNKMKYLIVGLAMVAFCIAATDARADTELTMYYPVAVGGPLTSARPEIGENENAGHLKIKPVASSTTK